MKDTLKKGLSLGIGLAVTSKEQVEKAVDELVKKGEMSKQESKAFIQDVWKKGEEYQKDLDEKIQKKLNGILEDLNAATKAEVNELKDRVERLEKQLREQHK